MDHQHHGQDGFSAFARLVWQIGLTSKTNEKLTYLLDYLTTASEADSVWLIALFSGRQPARIASGALLRQWCQIETGLPLWLIEESYSVVGDLAETIALLQPGDHQENVRQSLADIVEQIVAHRVADEAKKQQFVTHSWSRMSGDERFVFNKLLTGNFRIGISKKTVINAVAQHAGTAPSIIAHRISGHWNPMATRYGDLVFDTGEADPSRPYPFFLAHAVPGAPEDVGAPADWQAEWKWDGIRGQIIKRSGELFVWSRGEELMTDKFPEYAILKDLLPDGTVLDGEILSMRGDEVLPFNLLQTRIGRKNLTKKILQEAPVGFIAYDLLEWEGVDYREKPLHERRAMLESLLSSFRVDFLRLSKVIDFKEWQDLAKIRETSREHMAEGMMLKRRDSVYGTGRKTGAWWKWKIDPLVIDAVMVYAQKGAGRRSNLYTDYTFAVRNGDDLVTFTKAYSGLTDEEFRKVDAFVKRNSIEKFGPVRTVKPELVFEIAFEGIAASNRHKSGVALRFPRISRWRHDKTVEEINTLDDLKEMLLLFGNTSKG